MGEEKKNKDMLFVVTETSDNRLQANNLKFGIVAVADSYDMLKNKIHHELKIKLNPEFFPETITYRVVRDEQIRF